MTSKILARLLLASSAALCLFVTPSAFSQQTLKIGAVDMQKVFAEYYKTKKAEAELKDRAAGYDKELKASLAELQKTQEDGRKLQADSESPVYDEKKKAELRRVVEGKLQEFRIMQGRLEDMANSRKKDLAEQQSRIRGAIVEEINKVIQDYAKKNGFTIIIDRTGMTLSGVPPFVYVQESLDITADIIKLLNANAPASTATPTPPVDSKKPADPKK